MVAVSVIVPIYNIEDYVEECIKSILAQTLKNIEVILVDDGSTDGSSAICDKYAEEDKRIKVIHKNNNGLVSARKAGLKIATGAYIGYVDGDDWIEPEMYQDLYKLAQEENVDVVVAGLKRDMLGSTKSMINLIPCGVYDKRAMEKKVYPKMLYTGVFYQYGIYTYVWNKLFRRELLLNSQMIVDDNVTVGEDAVCTYYALVQAKRIFITDTTHYHYRQRAGSMLKSVSDRESELNRIKLLYLNLKEIFEKSLYSDIIMPQVRYFIASLLMMRSDLAFADYMSNKCLYPFKKVKPSSKIVLCSSGSYGQNLYRQIQLLREKGLFTGEITGWIDPDYKESQKLGLPVTDMASVSTMRFDYVVIAVQDGTEVRRFQADLEKIGVPKEKIEKPCSDLSHINKILKKYEIS